VTKSELIQRLAARYPQLVSKDAEVTVKVILDSMAKSITQGGRIEIRGFGSFGLNHRPPRVGRNPKSGEMVSQGSGEIRAALQSRQGTSRKG
jgi:integration host factor subunit beta